MYAEQQITHVRRVRQYWKQLDPEAFRSDQEADRDDPFYRPNVNIITSTKEIWLYAKDPAAGQKMFCQHPYYAAQWLARDTHRVATEEEIAEWKRNTALAQDKSRKEQHAEANQIAAALGAAIRDMKESVRK